MSYGNRLICFIDIHINSRLGGEEALRVLQRHVKATGEVLEAAAAGQHELVEAGVAARQALGAAVDQAEGRVEAVEGRGRGAGGEAQELAALGVCAPVLPEPEHRCALGVQTALHENA